MIKFPGLSIIAALVVALGISWSAGAHGDMAEGAERSRHNLMKQLGKIVKELSPMMRGDLAYDAELVRDRAEQISSRAGAAMTDLFPEGSRGKKSRARVEIWQQWDAFEAMAARLRLTADGMALAAHNEIQPPTSDDPLLMGQGSSVVPALEEIRSPEQMSGMPANVAFDLVTQNCSGCHTKFRHKKR